MNTSRSVSRLRCPGADVFLGWGRGRMRRGSEGRSGGKMKYKCWSWRKKEGERERESEIREATSTPTPYLPIQIKVQYSLLILFPLLSYDIISKDIKTKAKTKKKRYEKNIQKYDYRGI